MHLNVGDGCPWAGQTMAVASPWWVFSTSNLSLDVTFGGALPIGSVYRNYG